MSLNDHPKKKEALPAISSAGRPPFLTPATILLLLIGLAAAIVLTLVFRHADLSLSLAAQALPGAHDDFTFWWMVNYYGEIPTWTVVGIAAFLFVLSGRRAAWRSFRPHLRFLLLTALLSPGLLDNLLKLIFNRPRPGDGMGFFPLFVLGPGRQDNGFPSGHTAAAFVLLALVFLIPRERRLLRLLAAVAFFSWGAAVGAARVVWGAHYPSDVLYGALLTILVELVLWLGWFRRRTNAGAGCP